MDEVAHHTIKECVRHTPKPNRLTSHDKMHQRSAENQMAKQVLAAHMGE